MISGKADSGKAPHENQAAATRGEQRGTKLRKRNLEEKWIEVSADYEVLDAFVKEKKITWSKSGRESAKREADLHKTLEKAATDEKKEERDRESLATSGKLSSKGKKKKMRQRASWKK